MKEKMLAGVISYVITPYDELGNIDVIRMKALIENLIKDGADAIAILGCAGECTSLSIKEKQMVISLTVDCVSSRLPVVVGICEVTTLKSAAMAKYAQSQNVDVLMISPAPNYHSDHDFIEHFRIISESVTLPIMAYNNPARTGKDISVDLLCNLVEQIHSVHMIKESSCSVDKVQRLVKALQGKANVLCGCNFISVDALLLGANGWCTVAPSLIGSKAKLLYELVQSGNEVSAQKLFEQYRPLFEFMVNNGLASVVKAGLNSFGQKVGEPRKPLRNLDELKKIELMRLLNQLETSN